MERSVYFCDDLTTEAAVYNSKQPHLQKSVFEKKFYFFDSFHWGFLCGTAVEVVLLLSVYGSGSIHHLYNN